MRGKHFQHIAGLAVVAILVADLARAQDAQVSATLLPALTESSPNFVQSRIAQRLNLGGRAVVRLTIASDGLVFKARLLQSSGQPLLDAAAVVTALRSQEQSEAHPSGKPMVVDAPIVFSRTKSPERKTVWPKRLGLPDHATPPRLLELPTSKDTESAANFVSSGEQVDCEILIGADGTVVDVKPLKTGPIDYSTAITLLYIEKQRYAPALVKGKPVAVRIIERIDWPYSLIGEPRLIAILGPPWIRMLTKQALEDNIYALDKRPAADPSHQSGLLHLQKKEYDAAIADLSEAIRRQPENTDVISSRADAYLLRTAPGDKERALVDDQHMIDLTPDDPRVWASRADNLLTLKMPAKALVDINRAIFALPEASRLYLMRADDEDALGDAAAALADRKTAETIEPGITFRVQTKNNEEHILQNAIITPDGPARLDPNWDKPLVTTALVQKWHLSGAVPLMVRVGMDGRPENFKIVTSSGSALLDKAAILSAAEWGYLPATKKGEAETEEDHWIPVTVEYPKSADAAAVPDWPQPLPAEASAPQRLAAPDDEIAKNYPPLARLQQMEGNTQLDLLIGSDGTVQNIAVRQSSSHSLLDAAAFKLAETWRYAPAQLNGVPVPARITVSLPWKLPPQ